MQLRHFEYLFHGKNPYVGKKSTKIMVSFIDTIFRSMIDAFLRWTSRDAQAGLCLYCS